MLVLEYVRKTDFWFPLNCSGTQKLGSTIPVGLFQLRIFYDSLWSEMDLFKLYILIQIWLNYNLVSGSEKNTLQNKHSESKLSSFTLSLYKKPRGQQHQKRWIQFHHPFPGRFLLFMQSLNWMFGYCMIFQVLKSRVFFQQFTFRTCDEKMRTQSLHWFLWCHWTCSAPKEMPGESLQTTQPDVSRRGSMHSSELSAHFLDWKHGTMKPTELKKHIQTMIGALGF